jgi:hypothetical protein
VSGHHRGISHSGLQVCICGGRFQPAGQAHHEGSGKAVWVGPLVPAAIDRPVQVIASTASDVARKIEMLDLSSAVQLKEELLTNAGRVIQIGSMREQCTRHGRGPPSAPRGGRHGTETHALRPRCRSSSSTCRRGLVPSDHACTRSMVWNRADQSIAQPLVIALGVIVGNEVLNVGPQRFLSEQDHSLRTGFTYGPHETLGVRIQISAIAAAVSQTSHQRRRADPGTRS